MSPEELREKANELAARSRARQGLEERITDPSVFATIAAIVGREQARRAA